MTHYFFLILNTYTYQSYYSHGAYTSKEDIENHLRSDEKLIKTWVVVDDDNE